MEPMPMDRACSACGTAVAAEAAYCSRCGSALAGAGAQAGQTKPKWYYNVWFTLFMLFFVLGPLGLPLVWKNPHFSRRVKAVLTLITIAYTILLVDVTLRTVRAVLQRVEQFNSTLQF